MIQEITNYFNDCMNGIVKTIFLPIGILIIIARQAIKEREVK